jgi:hypothetical protein
MLEQHYQKTHFSANRPMKPLSSVSLFLLPFLIHASAWSAELREDFSHDPASDGWQMAGTTNLFSWNGESQALDVTWDSSKPNSFFYHPLHTVASIADDFSLELDLVMKNIQAGVDPNKPYAFELTFGFLNLEQAFKAGFIRGTSANSPDLVEWSYFPDTGFGATISPVITTTNSRFFPSFNFPLELTPDGLFHIKMIYIAGRKALSTTITLNGEPFGPIEDALLPDASADFRINAFSITSYSDAGQQPGFEGSLFAQGTIDNITLNFPDPPVRNLRFIRFNNQNQATFDGSPRWLYTLERSGDLFTWQTTATPVMGETAPITIGDTNAPANVAFYRVRAVLP